MRGGTPQQLSADQSDLAYAESLGIAGSDDAALAALRALPAEKLVEGLDLPALVEEAFRCPLMQFALPAMAGECVPVYHGIHMIDEAIMPEEPGDALRNGHAARVPMIIGSTAADMPLHFPPSVLEPYAYFGEDAERASAHYSLPLETAQSLVASGQPELVAVLPILAIGADMTMHEGSRYAARQMAAAGNPVWLYRFTYVAESQRPSSGQTHAGELPFLFQTLDARYAGAVTEMDRQAAQIFSSYIANFIKAGDPNNGILAEWPLFDAAHYDLMDFTDDDGPVYGPDPRAEGVELVERAAER
jgi:para-nitrobenzyl esterase